MKQKVYLAVDLGASGGRVIAGWIEDSRLLVEEIHRFENGPMVLDERWHWDYLRLWSEIKIGLNKSAARFGDAVVSVGVDTWGVDYALLGLDNKVMGLPTHYRDQRTRGIFDEAFAQVAQNEIFAETGLQFLEFNTLFQLVAAKRDEPELLNSAERLLMMPDLFHWLLCGELSNEQTIASTSQLVNPTTQNWSTTLIERFGLPSKLFGPLSPPGTKLGKLLPEVASETNLDNVQVVLPGSHDTASAVLAVPADGKSLSQNLLGGVQRPEKIASPDGFGTCTKSNWCYLSLGTWALLGVESPSPIINAKAAEWNFTNEAGVGGTTRLLKNITGLWLVQECRRVWKEAGQEFSWSDLAKQAAEAPALASVVPPDDARFAAPANMPEAIADYCRETGQAIPQSPGEIVRAALEGVAQRSCEVLGWLEELTGNRLETIHIVGGGTQNRLLCQLIADACDRSVVAGPVEATAIGNLLVQAQAAGELKNTDEARQLVRNSVELHTYEPKFNEQ